MSTDCFIFGVPKRVMPSTSPRKHMTSASSVTCRQSISIPCCPIVYWISSMMVCRAASMPSVFSTSAMCVDRVAPPRTPRTPRTSLSPAPSTSSL